MEKPQLGTVTLSKNTTIIRCRAGNMIKFVRGA